MPLITELKYNANDFNNIDLDDLIVVFEGDITIEIGRASCRERV